MIESNQLNNKKINKNNIYKILFFTIYIILIIYIHRKSSYIANFILIITLVDGILYILLSKSNTVYNKHIKLLKKKELKNILKLLRYATAVLSFISLMTTAKGFQALVFSDNEAWLSYLASFAVQSILVCFSLTYCHIFSKIKLLKTISERGKSLATGILTLFLSVAFVTSSSFSFSYIANNAYALSWANDSESIIERHLILKTADLEKENTRIGNLLFKKIQENNDILNGFLENYTNDTESHLKNSIKKYKLDDYKIQVQKGVPSTHEFGLTDSIINGWINKYASSAEDINGLVNRFDNYVSNFHNYYDEYDQISSNFKKNKNSDDPKLFNSLIDTTYNQLNLLSQNLNVLISSCDNLRVFILDKDIVPYRDSLKNEISRLKNHIDSQTKNLKKFQTEIEGAENGYLSDKDNTLTIGKIKDIQTQIYTLDIQHTTTEENNVDSIVEDLSKILITYANSSEILDDNSKESILNLVTLIKEYKTYIILADKIEKFTDTNLSKTYSINTTESDTTKASDTIKFVSYNEWIDNRNQDFLMFFDLLKKLPKEPETLLESKKELESDNENTSATTDILQKSNTLRRDLLGEITDFERAFNYFKYDFKTMAYFSAFIAVFFDLSAFLTGCFIYILKHFKNND